MATRRQIIIKYLFFHFIHLAFSPVVGVTHITAYLLASVFGVSHPLYRYNGVWTHDMAVFLLMAVVLALALGSVGSFAEVLVAGHKYAVIYYALLYFEAVKMSFLIPIALLSLIFIDIAFHYLIYINTLVIEKIRKTK